MESGIASKEVGKVSARIVIDARKLGDGGIGVYIKNLVDGLVALKKSGELVAEITLLCQPSACEFWECQSLKETWGDFVEIAEESSAKYSLSEYFLMSRRQKKLLEKSHLFHSPHYTLPFFLSVPSVVTIHDVIHVTHPQTIFHKIFGKALIASALKRASAVVTVSEYSAKQIVKFFSSKSQITVAANAAQDEIRAIDLPVNEQQNSNPFCLFVGNSKPHKRLDELLKAWSLLGGKPEIQTPSLVVVSSSVTEQQEEKISELSNVMLLKECPATELNSLYNSALALLIPSTEEGFGLPVLEAFLCKTAVVSTPLESVKEYFGDSVWYSEDYSAATFATAVGEMISDSKTREKKIEDGHAKALSFDKVKSARATAVCYGEVISSVYEKGMAPRVFSESSSTNISMKRVGE